jgi:hypothetical protein
MPEGTWVKVRAAWEMSRLSRRRKRRKLKIVGRRASGVGRKYR